MSSLLSQSWKVSVQVVEQYLTGIVITFNASL
nr:MAG TPA: hypothetical protein [Caudoviricetes sp.]